MVIIGIDLASGPDKTAATYTCARCHRLHTFTIRPERLPLMFSCECGNKITVDDPILRGLPEDFP